MKKDAERFLPRCGGTALLLACLMLGACGGNKEAATNSVEMRDMEVVDGTVNDAMTDLDAARADGTALANTGTNDAGAATPRRAPKDAAEAPVQNEEAVAAE